MNFLSIKSNLIHYFSLPYNFGWFLQKKPRDDVEPLYHFASQVVYLQIDRCRSLDVLKKINLVDYSHLHILKLCQLNATQLDAIRAPNFPHLKHLSLAETKNFSLQVLYQFKSLRSCELHSLQIDTQYSNLSSSSSSIQSFILHRCDPKDMAIILRLFSQLIYFKTFFSLDNRFVHEWNPVGNFVHPNLESFDIYFLDTDSHLNETDSGKYNSVTKLLTSISFDKCIRYRLTLIDTVNFNFEQLQHTVRKLHFIHFSCRLIWFHKYHPSPNIDCIRQVPLFNQLKIIHTNSTATLYRSRWTSSSISSD